MAPGNQIAELTAQLQNIVQQLGTISRAITQLDERQRRIEAHMMNQPRPADVQQALHDVADTRGQNTQLIAEFKRLRADMRDQLTTYRRDIRDLEYAVRQMFDVAPQRQEVGD